MFMKHKTLFLGIGMALIASPAFAQVDLDMSYTQSATDAARNGMLSSNLPHNQNRSRSYRGSSGGGTSKAEARATCENGRRLQSGGDPNPNLRRLAQMCAQAGL